MKIYTKTGDKGTTALFGGSRVPKNHIRIESYGTVDELNAHLGMLRDCQVNPQIKQDIELIQNKLFTLGSILATDPKKAKLKSGKDRLNIPRITAEDITYLEDRIDVMNESLPQMTHFVLPGGHKAVSQSHIARCVCRRAERNAAALYAIESFDDEVLQYLNRLSDYIFVVSRKTADELDVKETQWIPEKLDS
ncbi:MAG: cob(I)yrinic acid a,c-diamide adenosyltransferase [Psychroflexus sp.]|nr:cob(I)yrinic acid a,c-diamide adenosyltransferase [Psychroflexus sp.]MDN6310477.1 cob(I)yrinic acid a,c-diamide adenosyltransferase [Psychroflexus sp.]